ncbi:MAG: RIP metalloprotease RseP [Gemmatimonadota bacterium]
MLAWLAPILVFGLVIFVHELGHFLAAKMVGVYAPVFSFGWGSRLWGIRRGETDYRISWLPIGGFVAMATKDSEGMSAIEGGTNVAEGADGSEGQEEKAGHQKGLNPIPWDPNAYRPFGPRPVPRERWIESKSLGAKIFVLSAGVAMNAILALVVSVGTLATLGRPYLPAVVDSVVVGRPAAIAGIERGDSIVAVAGTPIERWTDFVAKVSSAPGQALPIEVVRAGGQRESLTITPDAVDEPDPITGELRKVGQIGVVRVNRQARETVGLGTAVADGWRATVGMSVDVVRTVGGLFAGDVSVKQLGGPITIARTSFAAAQSGIENLLFLIAFLSVNLAILNLLPIPLLDGGQILVRIIEAAKGSELSARTQEYLMRVGMLAILALFVLVMYNDIVRWVQDIIGRVG